MKILFTGSEGYIGVVLGEELLKRGYHVCGFDTGYFSECHLGKPSKNFPIIRKDIRNIAFQDVQSFDTIIHLAALSNDPLGDLEPRLTEEINTLSTLRMAEYAQKAGVKRFLFSSSCSIYGAGTRALLNEDSPFNPQTTYAKSKGDIEEGLRALATDTFSPVYLRNATAFGFSSRLRFDLVVNNLTGSAFTCGKIRVSSDGTPWRPLVHVKDIARAFIAVLEAPQEDTHNQAFNIGFNDQNFQVKDIALCVQHHFPECTIEFGPPSGDTRTYNVDFSKFNRLFPSFEANRVTLDEGIAELKRRLVEFSITEADFTSRLYSRLKQIRYLVETGRIDKNLYWTS